MSTPPTIACFGDILWDILPTGRRPAGAAFHVALHLYQLGHPVQLISRVGDDELGRELVAYTTGLGLDGSLVQQSETHLTGVVKTTIRQGQEVSGKILEPIAWDYIRCSAALRTAVGQAGMLVYNSLAARHFTSRETLYRLLLDAPLKVFNVHLQAPHYSREVVKYLLQQADLVLLNQQELTEIMGWLGQPATPATALPWLAGHFGLQAVCVTQGVAGASLWANNELFTCPSVAAADWHSHSEAAFLASLLIDWLHPRAPADCLHRARSASTSAALATAPIASTAIRTAPTSFRPPFSLPTKNRTAC